MAASAATASIGGITATAAQKGTLGNLITLKIQTDPAGSTGANTLVESGNAVTVKLANAAGTISSTISGVKATINTGRLIVASGGTDANTGAQASGAGGAGVPLASGADGTYGYDDLAAATTDGWTLVNHAAPSGYSAHAAYDELIKVDSTDGRRVRATGEAATGATNAVSAAYRIEAQRAAVAKPRSLRLLGASGNWNNEYVR